VEVPISALCDVRCLVATLDNTNVYTLTTSRIAAPDDAPNQRRQSTQPRNMVHCTLQRRSIEVLSSPVGARQRVSKILSVTVPSPSRSETAESVVDRPSTRPWQAGVRILDNRETDDDVKRITVDWLTPASPASCARLACKMRAGSAGIRSATWPPIRGGSPRRRTHSPNAALGVLFVLPSLSEGQGHLGLN
jgi:hypothetical protein